MFLVKIIKPFDVLNFEMEKLQQLKYDGNFVKNPNLH